MLTGTPDADRYWRLVKRTIKEVFSGDPDAAKPLEQDIRNSSQDEQELFYHGEPLSTAADIADKSITADDINRYKHIRQQVYALPSGTP